MTALLALAAFLSGAAVGAWVKADARYAVGLRAGRSATELEHGWHPTSPTRRFRLHRRRPDPGPLVYRPASALAPRPGAHY